MALGGAWDGLASLLALNAPAERRGWYAMIPQLGAPLGLIVASGLFAFFLPTCRRRTSSTGAGATRSSSPSRSTWWRCSRGCAWSSTPEYEQLFESRELQPSRIDGDVRSDGRTSSSAPSRRWRASRCSTWSRCSRCRGSSCSPARAPARFLMIEIAGAVIGVLSIVASGLIADRSGGAWCSAPRRRDRGLQRFRAAIAGHGRLGAATVHGGGLRAARPRLRSVVRRDRIQLLAALALHRLGTDLGPRLAVRRRLRAARRPAARDEARALSPPACICCRARSERSSRWP